MHNLVENFLQHEEQRRNRSLSKRFRDWLSSDKGKFHHRQIERALSGKNGEDKALKHLVAAEQAYKADDSYRKQDARRKKSLKQFHSAFEDWLISDRASAYKAQIDAAGSDDDAKTAREEAEKAFARAHPHLLPPDYRDISKTKIRPVRQARLQDAAEISLDVLEPGLNQMGLVGSQVLRNWDKIVGPALATNTRPERISFAKGERSNGTLFVMARQGFNTIIQHSTNEIIFRINSHFGYGAVKEIRISRRYFTEVTNPGKRAAHQILQGRIRPSSTLAPHVSKMIEQVSDPDLQQAFTDLGHLIKARNN